MKTKSHKAPSIKSEPPAAEPVAQEEQAKAEHAEVKIDYPEGFPATDELLEHLAQAAAAFGDLEITVVAWSDRAVVWDGKTAGRRKLLR